jgi:hypothetical protein
MARSWAVRNDWHNHEILRGELLAGRLRQRRRLQRKAHRVAATLIALLAWALAAPVRAPASPINECGQLGAANGYQTLTNITSRDVPCPTARHDAFVLYREVGSDSVGHARCPRNCVVGWQGWRINVHYFRWVWDGGSVGWLYGVDVRATGRGGRVVHFQAEGE